ncbi:MAG: NAD(P)(+) transhydrogenase (Re/Si-specific) subunit beta [Gemmatimonadota bacterium]
MIGSTLTQLAYLLSAVLFIVGLKRLSSPDTARSGNALASTAMLLAVVATLLGQEILDFTWIVVGGTGGALVGAVMARTVKMTAMPQMVAVFNGFGGGASALVAAAEFLGPQGTGLARALPLDTDISILAGTLIGSLTFSGSLVAFGKLQGVAEQAVTYPLQKSLNSLLVVAALGAGAYLSAGVPADTLPVFAGFAALALVLGVLVVLPIGGADMPVVVALLNSYSGLAASAAGFVLSNMVLIISGALVGASGLILTAIMCRAMNRSLTNVLFGAFGGGEEATAAVGPGGERSAKEIDAENAAMLLGYARQVVIVPGYGLAVAQAQHKLREMADLLRKRGVTVKYAIHPVAGRMPGHMNVLLAEANVPYDQLYEIEDVNPEMPGTDVALVVGANDVTNPAARDDPTSPIAGMPIVEVDRAQHAIVMKRSLSPGFAGVENELFFAENTFMFFGDAADSLSLLNEEIKEL